MLEVVTGAMADGDGSCTSDRDDGWSGSPGSPAWSGSPASSRSTPVGDGRDAPDVMDVVDAADVRAHLAQVAWEARDLGWVELVELGRSLGPDPALREHTSDELDRLVRVQAAQLAAETCRWLELVAELVVRGVWADQGASTPGQWLSWTIGLAPSTAREHVRVALQLRTLPLLRQRFRAGRISYSKVRALTRIAVPEIEAMLVRWADGATAADIERIVSSFRRTQRGRNASAKDRERGRSVFRRAAPDGLVDVVARVLPEEAMRIESMLDRLVALEREAEDDARQELEAARSVGVRQAAGSVGVRQAEQTQLEPAPDDGSRGPDAGSGQVAQAPALEGAITDSRPSYGARRVDALTSALSTAVAAGPADTSGADRDTLVVHVDVADLAEAEAGGSDGVAVHDRHGRTTAMDRRVLRRLACDAGIVLVARDDDGTPMDVGRRERRLSAALRRALLARDRSCRFPGCGATRHLHAHHVHHWADGGPTDLANLVLLCSTHHRFVHDRSWTLTPTGTGRFTFAPPGARTVPAVWRLPDPSSADDRDLVTAPDVRDDPGRLLPRYWYGPGELDVDLAVAVLDQELRQALPAHHLAEAA